jgi:hypothetical protein
MLTHTAIASISRQLKDLALFAPEFGLPPIFTADGYLLQIVARDGNAHGYRLNLAPAP